MLDDLTGYWRLLVAFLFTQCKGVVGGRYCPSYSINYCQYDCCGGEYAGYYCCSSTYTTYFSISWYVIVPAALGGIALLASIGSLIWYWHYRIKPRRLAVTPLVCPSSNITVVHSNMTSVPSYTRPQLAPYYPTAVTGINPLGYGPSTYAAPEYSAPPPNFLPGSVGPFDSDPAFPPGMKPPPYTTQDQYARHASFPPKY